MRAQTKNTLIATTLALALSSTLSAETPTDPLKTILLEEAHGITKGSQEVTVALLSTGLNCRLPQIKNSIVRLEGAERRFDACESIEGAGPTDLHHGNYSASVILKVAPGIRILPIRIFGPNGAGSTLDMAQGIQLALQAGANAIAIGGGGSASISTPSGQAVCDQIEAARLLNVPVVAPAGNSGSEITTENPMLVASCKNDTLFTVAGLDPSLMQLARFSSYSSYFVQLAAPSAGIKGLDAAGRETQFVGTTVSYLIATGLMALRLSVFPNESVEDRREGVLSASFPLESLVGKTESAGIVDALAFVESR